MVYEGVRMLSFLFVSKSRTRMIFLIGQDVTNLTIERYFKVSFERTLIFMMAYCFLGYGRLFERHRCTLTIQTALLYAICCMLRYPTKLPRFINNLSDTRRFSLNA